LNHGKAEENRRWTRINAEFLFQSGFTYRVKIVESGNIKRTTSHVLLSASIRVYLRFLGSISAQFACEFVFFPLVQIQANR
jgi:hypothetical protein